MFNAIFGNFLFSRATPQVEVAEEQVETGTQTSQTANISTQTTSFNNEASSDTLPLAKEQAATNVNKKSDPADWVIVDPSEEAEKITGNKRSLMESGYTQTEDMTTTTTTTTTTLTNSTENENLVDMTQQSDESNLCYDVKTEEEMRRETEKEQPKGKSVIADDDDDDVMLGSFFDKNEHDDAYDQEVEENNMMRTDENEDDEDPKFIGPLMPPRDVEETWLITPLPCLTSITSSQRSIVDNGTLENLLIEHPSMSIFMSATASSSSPAHEKEEIAYENKMDHPKQNKLQNSKQIKKQQKKENEIKAKAIKNENMKATIATVTLATGFKLDENKPTYSQVLKEKQPKSVPLVKSVAEKRKETEKSASNSDLANTSAESSESLITIMPCNLRKKDKKSKKTRSSNGSLNKENLQVKTLLMNDFKKSSGLVASRFDCSLTNKNQMKRNNKNINFSKNANKKQRKYHNLQQPNFFSNSANQQY